MPLDPVVQRRDTLERHDAGLHDMTLTSQHEAQCEEDGITPIDDPYKEYDLWVARNVIKDLLRVYKGYPWCVESDVRQHLLKISIPVLMGVNNWYVFNLRQTEPTPGAILLAAGELLERYGCSRGKFLLDDYLAARELHSALVVPSRTVPG
jgi:hypothetical protein